MDAITPYVYMVLWFICGLLLIFRYGKENKIFYFLGAFFLFLGVWWAVDLFSEIDLFAGVWPWVLRGISAIALAGAVWAYYKEKKKTQAALEEEAKEMKDQEQENAVKALMAEAFEEAQETVDPAPGETIDEIEISKE